MAYDPELADRIRDLVGATPGIRERKMFGGLVFLVDGNIAASAYKDGGLMIRSSAEDWEAFCSDDGARPMLRKGAPVSGWVLVESQAVQSQSSLAEWVERGLAHAAAQPPK